VGGSDALRRGRLAPRPQFRCFFRPRGAFFFAEPLSARLFVIQNKIGGGGIRHGLPEPGGKVLETKRSSTLLVGGFGCGNPRFQSLTFPLHSFSPFPAGGRRRIATTRTAKFGKTFFSPLCLRKTFDSRRKGCPAPRGGCPGMGFPFLASLFLFAQLETSPKGLRSGRIRHCFFRPDQLSSADSPKRGFSGAGFLMGRAGGA